MDATTGLAAATAVAVTAQLVALVRTTTPANLSVTAFAGPGVNEHIAIGVHQPGETVELHALTTGAARRLGEALVRVSTPRES